MTPSRRLPDRPRWTEGAEADVPSVNVAYMHARQSSVSIRGLGNNPRFLELPLGRNLGEEFMRIEKQQWTAGVEFNRQLGRDWRLRLAIKGPIPGQVAHLCERAGLGVAAVRRQRIGRVGLDNLPAGQLRYSSAPERF